MAIRVLLVDDNALFRNGVAQILRADGRFDVVGEASNGLEAVDAARAQQPDLILMDLKMPGIGGIEAIRAIRAENAAIPIGVLTMFESRDYVDAAMSAGASGYVAKDATPVDFCEAARAVAEGRRDILRIPDASAAGSSGVASRLTPRELEVLRALATSDDMGAIARNLGISTKTLRNHVSNTYHKLGIYDRAQAVILAVKEGLVDVPIA